MQLSVHSYHGQQNITASRRMDIVFHTYYINIELKDLNDH